MLKTPAPPPDATPLVARVVPHQGSELMVSGVEVRLAVLEAQEEACPRGLAAGLADKFEVMSTQQVHIGEEVVRQ